VGGVKQQELDSGVWVTPEALRELRRIASALEVIAAILARDIDPEQPEAVLERLTMHGLIG